MLPVSVLLGLVLHQASASAAQAALDVCRAAVASGKKAAVVALFAKPEDAPGLIGMAENRGGLQSLKVAVFPTPPGWERGSGYWAIFHTFQDIEEDHDRVYRLVGDPLKLGDEVSESELGSWSISDSNVSAELQRETASISVSAEQKVGGDGTRAPLFRLNDIYNLKGLKWGRSDLQPVTASDTSVPQPKDGQVLRAGSLIIPWTTRAATDATFAYSAVVNRKGEDHINANAAYITAWWVPTLGRMPFNSTVTASGPSDWIIRSEGDPVPSGKTSIKGMQIVSYRSKFPISYPKIIAGSYKVAATRTAGGRTFTSYDLEPIDTERAKKEVDRMAEAAGFYDKTLVPFPYSSYECFEADDYYGIESYSYTLLAASIGPRYVAHEMGHTYFGGLVPCSYTKDSWNEGLTTYVDDVLTGRNVDTPLERGLQSVNVNTALNAMQVAHNYNGHSYWRGAYVMKMLENEIGLNSVLTGLRLLIGDRVGKDTSWDDLRQYFEKSSGKDLSWFWEQWVDSGEFPDMQLIAAETAKEGKGFASKVLFGVSKPYIMRFSLRLSDASHAKEEVVTSNSTRATFVMKTDFQPTQAEIVPMGFTLVHDKGLKLAVQKL